MNLDQLNSKEYIIISKARVHNLKNLSVAIPRNKLVVITGLSGSGKSSLAFDTLYAEGQRRYVESLSSYARQFLGRMSKPEVDYIKGISPAIAIEQKVNTKNPRSTVGTSTEIYEYLKLLYARIGKTYSPISQQQVKRHKVSDVTDFVLSLKDESKILILSPIHLIKGRKLIEQLEILMQQGFSRIVIEGETIKISDYLEANKKTLAKTKVYILIDRFIVKKDDEDLKSRIGDSVQTAFYEGNGSCIVEYESDEVAHKKEFSNKFELDGISFEEPSVNFFTFNNPFGACKSCEGFGSVIGIDKDLVIPNKTLSVFEEAVACWKGEKMSEFKDKLVLNAYKFNFPIHKPYHELSEEHKELLWTGNKYFDGIDEFFRQVEEQTYKVQYRVMLSRYRGKTVCPDCQGSRLRKDASYVKIAGQSILDLVLTPIDNLLDFFKNLKLGKQDEAIAKRLLTEIINRLQFLSDVGLGYLTLNRKSNTLSGGESQRINLATSLGSSLVGSMYILDEPSIGLHPRDTKRLISVLIKLRNLGNTVIVVEHDEDIIKAADEIIDIGPEAGIHGGELVFQGPFSKLQQSKSLTAQYMNGQMKIEIPEKRNPWKEFVIIEGAEENNLKSISAKIPLNIMTVITGVSGSGKTSLVKGILYPALKKRYGGFSGKTGKYKFINGNVDKLGDVEFIDQNPIGRSSRSNPATYVKAYDEIRNLFADQKLAKTRGYKPGYFSFNISGGRCETCEGDGTVNIEMQFMADIQLVCEECKGNRFKEEVLEVKYKDKSVADILNMTINESINFFDGGDQITATEKRIITKLKPLQDVGLGYLGLGQPSSTMSGGEAQRVKLAFFLSKGEVESPTLFIFDEPTTGLHFHDITNLLSALNLFADQVSKTRGYKPGYFSFNISGGRCETCEGDGTVNIEMQFMADIQLVCEECKGNRFKEEVLEVKYKDKSVADILNMTINESINFFDGGDQITATEKRIITKLKPLQDVGLGYLGLGQPSSTMSGGEAQRVKLAFFLSKGEVESPTLFIFDEPTTGLHFHDITNLLSAFRALIDKGHSLVIIEHNSEIIKSADWIIDMGPEGGEKGGRVIFEGIPEDLIKHNESYTGRFLESKFNQ